MHAGLGIAVFAISFVWVLMEAAAAYYAGMLTASQMDRRYPKLKGLPFI
jgi:hypothetical protein